MARTLAIGVGNTHLNWGLFDGETLVHRGRFPSTEVPSALPDVWVGVDAITAASVNEPALTQFRSVLSGASLPAVRVLGSDLPVPLETAVPHPEQVGVDRLLTCLAWHRRGGGAAAIVDFGTAVTIDLVTPDDGFRGGLILPGPELLSRSLAWGTDRLPEVEVTWRAGPYGRDTESAIGVGIFGLLCGGVEHHLGQLRRQFGAGLARVATGGGATRFASWIPSLDRIAPDLLLDGIRIARDESS